MNLKVSDTGMLSSIFLIANLNFDRLCLLWMVLCINRRHIQIGSALMPIVNDGAYVNQSELKSTYGHISLKVSVDQIDTGQRNQADIYPRHCGVYSNEKSVTC